jgi:hypothetical protein
MCRRANRRRRSDGIAAGSDHLDHHRVKARKCEMLSVQLRTHRILKGMRSSMTFPASHPQTCRMPERSLLFAPQRRRLRVGEVPCQRGGFRKEHSGRRTITISRSSTATSRWRMAPSNLFSHGLISAGSKIFQSFQPAENTTGFEIKSIGSEGRFHRHPGVKNSRTSPTRT